MSGGGGEQRREAQRARDEEAARELRISQGTAGIRNQFARAFNDEYYGNMKKAGEDFYRVPLDRQYQDSMTKLQAALARNGLSQSSVANKKTADLNIENVMANDNIAENIKNQILDRKADVANQESVAIGQLQGSADPAAAAAQAAGLIRSRSETPGWSPLGQVFTDASATLATQGELERSNNARYNMGVSNWGTSANRYLRNIGGR